VIKSGPHRVHLIAAGTLILCTVAGVSLLGRAQFPFDSQYHLLLRLMWQGNEEWIPAVLVAFGLMKVALVGWGLALLAVGWAGLRLGVCERYVRKLWPYSGAFAVYYFSATTLGRLVANVLYSLQDGDAVGLTGWLARLEGPTLLSLQARLSAPAVGAFASALYSYVWFGGLLAAVPVFILARNSRAAFDASIGPALLSVCALPWFVLIPVFDPWTLNPAYGPVVGQTLAVDYLYPGAAIELLKTVRSVAPGIVGSCLPSLHVAIPAYFCILAYRSQLRGIAGAFALLTLLVAWAVSWLGRHWITDSVIAVPFAWICVLAVEQLRSSVQSRRSLARL
jgi:hypothetical protein